MPNRIIKESITTSEKLASLSDFEFRLWIGLITQADDAGRGDARPAVIKGRVFPFRERLTVKDVGSSLRALADKGCVTLYEIGGRPYFYFPNWSKHQRVRDCKPKYPEPTEDSLRQVAADCGEARQSAAIIQSNPIQSESESESNNIPPYSPKGECSPTGEAPPHSRRFIPPDVEEVEAYCRERNNHIDAQRFVDFYASKGWKVGKEPMKDWKAAVRTWERRNDTPARASPRPNRGRDQYSTRSYSAKDLEKMGNEVSLE